ncbi:MAG: tetratricopeptide repeat protein [Rikenellaceae bacterium]
MERSYLRPTAEQTYEISSQSRPDLNFRAIINRAIKLQNSGELEQACEVRFHAAQTLQEALPEDEEVILEWGDENSRAALEVLYLSGIDNFLVADYELSSALLEMCLDLDPEDHYEATNLLAYNYLALGEFELFDEIINDISDKHPSRMLLLLWSSHLRDGAIALRELMAFKSRYNQFYNEFTSDEHPVDEKYLIDIESERPSKEAQARELWLQTEHLWSEHPEFIDALKG